MLVLGALIAACGAAPPVDANLDPTEVDSGDVEGVETRVVSVDGQPLVVAWADTVTTRSRGLMGVTDLGDLDGMVFDLGEERFPRFVMRDTHIDLDVVFFAADGSGVGKLTMTPCPGEPCPVYTIDRPARYALEAPAGALEMDADSRLTVD